MRISRLLLGPTLDHMSLTGPVLRADQWYGQADHVYTVSVRSIAFQGTLHIEAALTANPFESDFFAVIPPIVFGRRNPMVDPASENRIFSFPGVFTWLRARMERDALQNPALISATPSLRFGMIDEVLVNF